MKNKSVWLGWCRKDTCVDSVLRRCVDRPAAKHFPDQRARNFRSNCPDVSGSRHARHFQTTFSKCVSQLVARYLRPMLVTHVWQHDCQTFATNVGRMRPEICDQCSQTSIQLHGGMSGAGRARLARVRGTHCLRDEFAGPLWGSDAVGAILRDFEKQLVRSAPSLPCAGLAPCSLTRFKSQVLMPETQAMSVL